MDARIHDLDDHVCSCGWKGADFEDHLGALRESVVAAGPVTASCVLGHHDRCKALLPGQNRQWAGLVAVPDGFGGFRPGGFCHCACHTELRAP